MAEELEVPQDTPAEAPQPEAKQQSETVEKQGEATTLPADATSEGQPRKKGGFQKRIDKLTKTVYELSAQLEAAKAPARAAQVDEKEPSREEFDDLESFQRALATHTARRVIREDRQNEEFSRRQAEAAKEQVSRRAAWESHTEKASEKYDDGEDVLGHFMQEVEMHPYALQAIIESEMGADLAYYLGKNDQEAERISKLTPARQAIEIGKLEVKLTANPIKKASSAPAPINPVSGKAGDAGGLRDDLTTAEWIKRRQRQVRKGT